jgi:uncharacterized membrane protein
MSSKNLATHLLSGLLLSAGTLHFARPRPFDSLVPPELPGSQRSWTYASGVAELACGAAIAVPRTRRLGGLLAALLFVAVFPGNVKMAVDYQRAGKPLPARLIAFARLPLQYPLVLWALRVRGAGSRGA